ncbi:MAG: hypothetical protein ACLFOY_04520 [Desulfatibacillaceae bacterium]
MDGTYQTRQVDLDTGAESSSGDRGNGAGSGRKLTRQQVEKLKLLMTHLKGLMESPFTGYIKVNFSQGSIARIEKFEEILKK